MYYVYILQSIKDNKLYIGYSEDLRKRFAAHTEGKVFATKNRRPLHLVYHEAYLDRVDAKKREIFLKSGSGHRFLKKPMTHYFSSR